MSDEYDVIIIGAGPGGYVAAIRSGQLGLKTLLIEKESNVGGTCLNVGCIPSKTLLYYSEQLYENQHHRIKYGLEFSNMQMNVDKLMQTKSGVIKGLNMGVSSLLRKNKVTHKVGRASFIGPHEIAIDGKDAGHFKAKHIIIATGSQPRALPSLPFDEVQVVSSTGALSLKEPPKKMIVIGAGVIGLELGSVYKRLGSQVTFIETLDHIGGNLDPQLSTALYKSLQKQGLEFLLSTKVTHAEKKNGHIEISAETTSKEIKHLQADVVLVSIGRVPYTQDLGLEKVGIEKDRQGFIIINNGLETSVKNVYAIGDVVTGPMLAHKASEEGVAVVEKIAGHSPHINYVAIPNVIYTAPEVATVGFTAKEAENMGLTVKVGSFPFLANSRAHCVDAKDGLVIVVADSETDRVLGLHIMSEHAGEMIALGSLAIEMKVTAKQLGNLCFAHPTFSEAIKEAALAVHKSAIHF